MNLTYQETCWLSAEDQGLDAAMDTLDDAGITWELLQTGGFCMVIAIEVRDAHGRVIGEYGLTCDYDEWLLVWWPGGFDAVTDDEDDEERLLITKNLTEVLTTLLGDGFTNRAELEAIDADTSVLLELVAALAVRTS